MNITNKLAQALRALVAECEESADFGDLQGRGHQSELDALDAANAALAEYDAARDAERWKLEDSDAATSQGWDVFQADQLEIQRIDAPESGEAPRFDSDAQALIHVYDLALRGDPLCRKAMAVTLAESNIRK